MCKINGGKSTRQCWEPVLGSQDFLEPEPVKEIYKISMELGA